VRNLNRTLRAVLLLAVGLIVVFFLLENRQRVSLFFFGWHSPELPLSALVVLALLLGMAIGPLLVLFKRGLRRHRRGLVERTSSRQV
jgi:uncharacterized integral membrane protein